MFHNLSNIKFSILNFLSILSNKKKTLNKTEICLQIKPLANNVCFLAGLDLALDWLRCWHLLWSMNGGKILIQLTIQ